MRLSFLYWLYHLYMSIILIIWLYYESNGKHLHVKKLFQGEGEQKHVGRILEFFKTTEGEDYFRVQWFYRAEDTVSIWIAPFLGHLVLLIICLFIFVAFFSIFQVMKEEAASHDKKRIFCSTIMNDNSLDCIISKVNVLELTPRVCFKLDFELFRFILF